VAARLRDRLDVARLLVSEVGAVIGAHVGTGLVGVVVVPRTGATPAPPGR
jgi:fatty acid-binding protein DegV